MADAADAGDEYHRRRGDGGDGLGVVAGAAGQTDVGEAGRFGGVGSQLLHTAGNGHRRRVALGRNGDSDVLGVGHFLGGAAQFHLGGGQRFHSFVAELHAHLNPARYHVACVGMHVHAAHRTHPTHFHLAGDAPHGQCELRGRGHGVPAEGHRRGAGVVGLPHNVHVIDRAPGDAGNDADGIAAPVQCRPLLDMQFQIAGQLVGSAAGLGDAGDIAAYVRQTGGQRCAVVVNGGEVLRFPQAGHGAAAQEPAVEAGALLVGEHHNFQWVAGGSTGIGQSLDDLDGGDDAQRAVVLAAGGNGVGVGPQHDGRQRRAAAVAITFRAADDVAAGVDADGHTGGLHQLHYVAAAGHVKLGKGDALHPEFVLADLAQRGQVVVQTG